MESTPATLGAAAFSVCSSGAHWCVGTCMGQGRRRALILSVTLQRSSWVLSVHGSSAPGASGGDGGDCGTVGGPDGGGGEGDGDGGGGEGEGGGGLGDGGLGEGGGGLGGGGEGGDEGGRGVGARSGGCMGEHSKFKSQE